MFSKKHNLNMLKNDAILKEFIDIANKFSERMNMKDAEFKKKLTRDAIVKKILEEQSKELNDKSEKYDELIATVSPYYKKKVKPEQLEDTRKEIKAKFVMNAENLAKKIGIEIAETIDTIGGYDFIETDPNDPKKL